ncbi:MAG: HlyD family secretion protein [Mariniphaga sp.]|nr:HlyD family secretion protein [Mariniphaga sp.]
MESIFPQEIIRNSAENHFFKFSRKTSIIYSFTIGILSLAIVLLFIVKTEVTVLSRGLIRSAGEPVPITSPVNAEVIETTIKENGFVNTGDTLLWLNKEKHEEQILHLQNLISENNGYLNDIRTLLVNSSFSSGLKTELFKRICDEYRQKISEFNIEIELLQKNYNRTQMLFNKNVVPQTELEDKEYVLAKKLEEKEVFIKLNMNKWQQLANEYILLNKKYQNEITGLRKDIENYYILAPHTGYITNYSGILPGNFVTPGQIIGVISPSDSLITEHLIPPEDIGYLKIGMPAIFQVDAYNYSQWGFATGNIIEISKEVYIIENRPFFKVRCKMNEQYLSLKNGYKGELKKGLTTTTRFKVTERTIAQLLFDKADNWLNPNVLNE